MKKNNRQPTPKQAVPQKNQLKNTNGNSLVYAILIFLSVIFIYLCFDTQFLQDDSFITFRYVENFVHGNGLVFNIGEKVEGYTNFLWLLLLSIFAFLKFDLLSISQYLSVGFGVLILFAAYKISDIIKLQPEAVSNKKGRESNEPSYVNMVFNILPVILLVFTGAFTYWSVSGMESSMFIFFAMVSIYYYIKEKDSGEINYKFALFLFLASLTRPEGLYLFFIILFHKVVVTFVEKRNVGESLKTLFSKNNLVTYLIFIVPTGLYILFRLSYYGYPFPNTFYAKTGISWVYIQTGLEYTWNFFKSYLLFGIIYLLPLVLFRLKKNFFEISFLYILTFFYTLYVISVGGDVLQLHRFFLPVLPFFYILFAKFLRYVFENLRSKSPSFNFGTYSFLFLAVTVALALFNYYSGKEKIKSVTDLENGLVDKMRIAGSWFNQEQVKKGSPMTIAATTIGAVSYYAGLNVSVIDMLGLTDKEIAHNPQLIPEISESSVGWKERNYNVGYVLSRKPDYIYFSTGLRPSAYAERALFTSNEFLKDYYASYMVVKQYDFTDVVYKRKSDAEIQSIAPLPENPNYKKNFINKFIAGIYLSRENTKIQDAINSFTESIQTGPPEFTLPYQFIGEIHMKRGNVAEARKNFEKAVEMNDYTVLSHYYLYDILMKEGDREGAQKHLEKLMKYSPGMLQ